MTLDTETSPSDVSAAATRRTRTLWAGGGALGVVILIVAFAVFGGRSGDSAPAPAPTQGDSAAVQGVDPQTAALQLSTTYTSIDGAPADPSSGSLTDGLVVHPIRETPVHDTPNGKAIARMPVTQFGDTWLPVIAQQDGWDQVLLPSKPNSSTGWIRAADVESAKTPYAIKVHLQSKSLELVKNGTITATWKAGTGKASAPTPTVRTFLLGAFSDPKQKYSPVILPLGAHSPTHDTFGGGPGTVAIHTWPTSDVFGTASSDGCIRIPSDALKKLTGVPLGTIVLITND